jgi:hypothetical protein
MSANQNSDPAVSVIIPTHNRASVLAATVSSALAQTYPNKEIIVVDDGSTDDTAKVMAAFPGVIFRQKSQGGPASARNRALREASGTIIAPLDSDDAWDPDYLTNAVAGLEATGAGFVCTSYRGCRRDGTITYANYYTETRPHLGPYLTEQRGDWFFLETARARELFIAHSEAPSSAVVLRRSVLEQGWDDRLFGTEDHMILIQAIMDHSCSAAISLTPRWTKNTGTGNIYDESAALGRHARMNILLRRIVSERWDQRLTAAEVATLRQRNAMDYADWAYFESSQRRRLSALARYLQSAFSDWSVVAERLRKRVKAS